MWVGGWRALAEFVRWWLIRIRIRCTRIGALRYSSDPWAQVVYDQYRSGRGEAGFGFDLKNTEGHTFVVHNYAGARVTCAVIPNLHLD